ncbi:hypothetical protein FG99_02650 [Pseudomonas sp. AAC]|nr:hypothetical protein FG99_02650 [Pseudomonas sp. AAC]
MADDIRQRVLDLRRSHSLREVAAMTGLSLGTVKTLVSRSGNFRDNAKHRELFSLPPIRESEESLPSVPELPPQEIVTGDREIDAVLWLHRVIDTGNAALIERAMEGAKKIKTPLPVLQQRYKQYLIDAYPDEPLAALGAYGFCDLERLAIAAIERQRLQVEAIARFGDRLMSDTPAEAFCVEVLAGLEFTGTHPPFDEASVAERFKAHPELIPQTLADCLHELKYWEHLHGLRSASCKEYCQPLEEASSREWFVFGLLAEIRPRDREEAKAVFRYLIECGRRDVIGADSILENIIR